MIADHIQEVIFVGLPGPTHNYGGLSGDNVASSSNRGSVSNPREAALQALELIRLLRSLGIVVAVLPPQLRPHLDLLCTRFSGSPDELIRKAAKEDASLLETACSSSAMWAANAATVTPSIDAEDGKLHITVANLHTNPHRRIEAQDTHRVLTAIFAKVPDAVVHAPLPADEGFRDEGAANHMRLCPTHGEPGLNVFVYGTDGSMNDPVMARQNLRACEEIKAHHALAEQATLFLKQNPMAIGRGVFHNDVIAVTNESLLLVHERAYENGFEDIGRIEDACDALYPGRMPMLLLVRDDMLTLDEAVHTYFFNSQIVTVGNDMAIIAPIEVQLLYDGKAAALMEHIVADHGNPITQVHYVDLRQSMRNGGGPACLRLRVPMSGEQLAAVKENVNVMADDALLDALQKIIETHYPEELHASDLADPELYYRCLRVLTELSVLLKLPLV